MLEKILGGLSETDKQVLGAALAGVVVAYLYTQGQINTDTLLAVLAWELAPLGFSLPQKVN